MDSPVGKNCRIEATFSWAFAEFAESNLVKRVHEALIKTHLGQELIGHISRDGTAIEAREQPTLPVKSEVPVATAQATLPEMASPPVSALLSSASMHDSQAARLPCLA